MKYRLNCFLRQKFLSKLWRDNEPIRAELFSIEKLEQYAQNLALEQNVSSKNPTGISPLRARLRENSAILSSTYKAIAADAESGRSIVPAAEWILDNYHLVEEQIHEIRDDLPNSYYKQLPRLSDGPLKGFPRVFGLVWAFIAHTDSHLDPHLLRRFVMAYQHVQPLTIGELWAVAITLRIVLIENLRRLADQITIWRRERSDADVLSDFLLDSEYIRNALEMDLSKRSTGNLPVIFVAQLAKRLRGQDPKTTPALNWLEERLKSQGGSIDGIVHEAHHWQVISNVSVRNVMVSMRLISDIDWTEFFESISLVDHRMRAGSAFQDMDFATRNLYRSAIEQLARGSSYSELEIADFALAASRTPRINAEDVIEEGRVTDPGYYLISEGRPAFEESIAYQAKLTTTLCRLGISSGLKGYLGAIFLLTFLLLGLLVWILSPLSAVSYVAIVLVALFPVSEVAIAIVHRLVPLIFGPLKLPGLELSQGVPASLRTLVVVPTLLTNEADILEQIERLEVHYLTGAEGHITFALLIDGVDSLEENAPQDESLLMIATQAIDQMNRRHGPGPDGDRFLLLFRRRLFNSGENKWMGWERKRGKLHELNRLLRGATDTSFVAIGGKAPQVPLHVRYVITLDADTRLPRDAALKLIGKMGHPLNHPRLDPQQARVVSGYAVLQPRVAPSLPIGNRGSLYQKVFSGPAGIDPYAAAVSDVYQDLFSEGSYTGKGIYDVDAFEAALRNRVPENTLLSHDLFEGVFARAGLASDVEVMDDFPARYDVAAKRQHRWVRGDWQLLPWIVGYVSGNQTVPPLGRWKMIDNLRRSVLAPFTLILLSIVWTMPLSIAWQATLLILGIIFIPISLPVWFSLVPHRKRFRFRNYLDHILIDLKSSIQQTFLLIVFLPDQSYRMIDAIWRTLVRLFITRKHRLEWTTAAQSSSAAPLDVRDFYREMRGGLMVSCLAALSSIAWAPSGWPLIAVFMLLWGVAPALAWLISQSPTSAPQYSLSDEEAHDLRIIARRTWHYFESFVTPLDNMLPPDNFQEDPKPVLAHRTSPTNMGLYLLSAVAARDFGWAGTLETIERLEATLETMQKLPRFKGHFYNWYGTLDLSPLAPVYVSSVDSGNLAGHLLTVAQACSTASDASLSRVALQGMKDNLHIVKEIFRQARLGNERARRLAAVLDEIEARLNATSESDVLPATLIRMAEKAVRYVNELVPNGDHHAFSDLILWVEALRKRISEYQRDQHQMTRPETMQRRWQAIAETAQEMALGMDFSFLLDPDRKLLSIGYVVSENRLDSSCYDLLASEARLASLIAISKGDVSTQHWFRLGRPATPLRGGSALISWSGSMFEYLMPSLVMRAPSGSLLDQTSQLVVKRQQTYAESLGIPWGVSESAYNVRDIELTYQYSTFGIPGLGLKRGLSENMVVAPYATALAAMIDPVRARENFLVLDNYGGRGRYGFYEALDFTRSRVPEGDRVAVVRAYMAHHQGMTIVGIANALQDGLMRARFHHEPIIQASELLMQERMPRDIPAHHPRAEEVKVAAHEARFDGLAARHLVPHANDAPVTHLLSNGRYTVMLTAHGSGYSRWRDIAVTRWKEDVTCDADGSFIYLRDLQSGKIWRATGDISSAGVEHNEVIFSEDRVEYICKEDSLATSTEVFVSAEDDCEVRQVSMVNSARRSRIIELTSYSELVLAPPGADNAHPAFSKMFVVTEYLPEYDALVATRRPRSSEDPGIWVAHFAVVEGSVVENSQHETDRLRFLGRGRSIDKASVLFENRPLSNTVGTVLDPIFSLRVRVKIPAGRTVHVAFWTVIAASRTELLALIDKHHDISAVERVKTLAWTQAQVQLRHLDIDGEEAADFQRLSAPLLYADPAFRPRSSLIVDGLRSQAMLWPLGISGDVPIILLRIEDIEDMPQVRQLLRAHEYFRTKRFGVDLIILNERRASYIQDLQIALEAAVRSSQSGTRFGEKLAQGSAYVLRADILSDEVRSLLMAAARVMLFANRGALADQLGRVPQTYSRSSPSFSWRSSPETVRPVPLNEKLEFYNDMGGFSENGKEYVVVLNSKQSTPAPWINVISNPDFGFQVSAEGSGYTWAGNSRDNQLTPWSNDPVIDPIGEIIYVRDELTGNLLAATAQPFQDGGTYIARHGYGYSRFEHQAHGIVLELLQYVPLQGPVKISRLTLRNTSGRRRILSITAYVEWVLGLSRSGTAPFVVTDIDEATGALLARNPWSLAFSDRIAFIDMCGKQTAWTADRTEFIGRHNTLAEPALLKGGKSASGRVGGGLDPCGVLISTIELEPKGTAEVVLFLGQESSLDAARTLIQKYRSINLDAVFKEVTRYWTDFLGTVQVRTPDRAMDILLNGWLQYQSLACRIWARSGFYQASGAYGFRDQLQDGMAITHARPQETRRHLLRTAGRQFLEGDVQHWWLPHSGQGIRTRISDDVVWLAFATATYLESSHDTSVLDEQIPFLEGPVLQPEQHDAFFRPEVAEETGTLFEHCARGLDRCIALAGEHGLPLIGTGDWNDGMNRVGKDGKGESVWLAWLLLRTLDLFIPWVQYRDVDRVQHWRSHAVSLREALERHAWDGAWYRRATFDDGTWLGSVASEECKIDSLSQSWAVLSGASPPDHAIIAMASLDKHLVRVEDGLALLFTPPFDKAQNDPGYIKGYPPGLRENGGQYTHAALWAVFAYTKLGSARKAYELFSLLNPIYHADSAEKVERYKVEPYVIAADVYSVAPHAGRGGWTWYTGSAGWMYRAGIEGILGVIRDGASLVVDPCIPDHWPGFEVSLTWESTRYKIMVTNSRHRGSQTSQATLDGNPLPVNNGRIRAPLDGKPHTLIVYTQENIREFS